MSSNYNSRMRAAEVIVKGREFIVAKRRERLSDLIRGETPPPPHRRHLRKQDTQKP